MDIFQRPRITALKKVKKFDHNMVIKFWHGYYMLWKNRKEGESENPCKNDGTVIAIAANFFAKKTAEKSRV